MEDLFRKEALRLELKPPLLKIGKNNIHRPELKLWVFLEIFMSKNKKYGTTLPNLWEMLRTICELKIGKVEAFSILKENHKEAYSIGYFDLDWKIEEKYIVILKKYLKEVISFSCLENIFGFLKKTFRDLKIK